MDITVCANKSGIFWYRTAVVSERFPTFVSFQVHYCQLYHFTRSHIVTSVHTTLVINDVYIFCLRIRRTLFATYCCQSYSLKCLISGRQKNSILAMARIGWFLARNKSEYCVMKTEEHPKSYWRKYVGLYCYKIMYTVCIIMCYVVICLWLQFE